MDSTLFLIGLLMVSVVIYRVVWRRFRSPKTTVRGLLRHYYTFEKTGLPERESLLRVLTNRAGWKNLPPVFLAEIIARLRSKEDVFRFVSLAEGYKFNRKQLRAIAAREDMETAMREVALWLVEFGSRLQKEKSFKEAVFVQKLALGLQPNQNLLKLSLATSYAKMERHDEAAPLFKEGLAQLEDSVDSAAFLNLLEPGANLEALRATYEAMYAACLKSRKNQPAAAS